MDNSEFMDYIVQPLTFEQMNLLYKANDIKYDRCGLYYDFIKTLNKLIKKFLPKIELVEISHNNGVVDEHLPLLPQSYVFNYLLELKSKLLILEFRDCSIEDLRKSVELVKEFNFGK